MKKIIFLSCIIGSLHGAASSSVAASSEKHLQPPAIASLQELCAQALSPRINEKILERIGYQQQSLEGHTNQVGSVEFNHDGSQIVTASYDNTACIWDATTGDPLQTFKHDGDVKSAAFNHDGSKIVTASEDIKVFTTGTGYRCSTKPKAYIWDTTTGDLLQTFEHAWNIDSAAFNHDGSQIATASDWAYIWDTTTGERLHSLRHGNWVITVKFNRDGSKMVSASVDCLAIVWDTKTGNQLHFLIHDNWVLSAAFNHDDSKVVTVADDPVGRIWHITSNRYRSRVVDLSDIAKEAKDGKVCMWDARGGSQAYCTGERLISAAFNHDGSKIVTTSISKADIRDATTGNLLHILDHPDCAVRSAAFNHDSTKIVTSSVNLTKNDNKAHIWTDYLNDVKALMAIPIIQKFLIKALADWEKGKTHTIRSNSNDEAIYEELVANADWFNNDRLFRRANDKLT